MEKEQIASLITKFDQFVQLSLQKKQSQSPLEEVPQNQVEKYRQDMEKRLKLKAPTQQDKFDRILSTIKDLKSFISVRDFMEQLGTTSLKKKTRRMQSNPAVSIKEQYESLRGGVYLQRVEEHLKRQNFRKKDKAVFCTELESDPFNPSQFGNWMENTLGKINPKKENMFHPTFNVREDAKHEEDDCLIEEHRKTYRQQFKVKPKLRQQCTEEYEQFSKISSLLTNRLRKLLKSNCASKNSKLDILDPPRPETPVKRYLTHRTSLNHTKLDKSKILKKPSFGRIKTAGNTRKEESAWKQNINKRLKNIIETEHTLEDI